MKKQKQRPVQTEESIEAQKGHSSSATNPFVQEGRNLISDLWKQTLKFDGEHQPQQPQKRGELKPGEVIDLREKIQAIEPAINYIQEIVHAERIVQTKSDQETKTKIQEILIQIKEITKTSKELAVEFKDVEKIERVPKNAGKYHANFVEWILSMLKSAREKVDNSLAWTKALKSKKSQRTYWNLFKKHGTSFGLSGEHVVAHQVG